MFPSISRISKGILHSADSAAQHTALLRRITDRIRNSLELKIVLQTAVDEVAALLKLDRCFFFWYSEDMQQVHIVCEQSGDRQAFSVKHYSISEFGSAAALIQMGKLQVSTSSNASPGWLRRLTDWLHLTVHSNEQSDKNSQILGAHSSLLVPVTTRDGSVGYIACLSDSPRRWAETDLDVIQAIAQQLEIAIRQAQLYEKTQKLAQREQLINQITTHTRQSLDLEAVLTQAIAQLLDALEIDRCLVHLVEDLSEASTLALDPHSASDQVSSHQDCFRRKHLFEACRPPFSSTLENFDTNGPITQWVIQHRQPVVIADITQDVRIGPDNAEYQLAQIKSSLVVPVQANSALKAILYLNQCSHTRFWSNDDRKLAEAVADQLAISIQQGQLYAKTRQQATESAAQARHLTELLQNLRQTQSQLIQSEKLSSLGQLVAGIAHEINNPVGFIQGNIPYIEQYTQDLVRLLEAYQAQTPQPGDNVQRIMQEIEVEFLLQDLPRILKSMKAGVERISNIVRSLRHFSHLDEAHCKEANIHQGLENTLFVLQHHLKSDVHIVRHYGDLPEIECYPRLLNQVFFNLLMNAIEAVEQSPSVPKSIAISTETILDEETQEPWIRVAIADNGCGIPHDIQAKVFDPFFTTKEVGQGAGLGLAVSYQTICNHHQGRLTLDSKPGHGSTLVIELPVRQHASLVRDRNHQLTAEHPAPAPLLKQADETSTALRA